ncbi:magnesium transporter [Aquiflexum gelatinilyticum]|uniref:Magnesium transporter MgtE n=1 Tax=Aquiflexum gelatinilyticum TaxID=2961943 RepID=A0A9X2P769_9BACT|nr:magnesium transporter [Aquiflexum gelatinilyticum]MCR9014787.1 magnesium transporter [Aquiflexum gelatinilyticum]MCS4434497.1 magnesium transporter [Aquiflexum gelatinilyticum]
MEPIKSFELSKEYLESLQDSIEIQNNSFIIESFEGANVADIASLLDELNMDEAIYVLRLLPATTAADILIELDEDSLIQVIRELETTELAGLIDQMESDDAADILILMPTKDREDVISHLQEKEKSANILDLLRYDEDSAGGLMAKEFIRANKNWNVVQTIEEIRRQAEKVEKIYSIYVVDNRQHLLGRVSLKKIILASSDTKISDIYEPELISIPTHMEGEEVAEIMRKYDLESVPVVNAKNRLVGRITVDDILDLIREQSEEDIQAMTGISADVEESDSIFRISKARLPWLLIGVIGGLMGAKIIGFFEVGLSKYIALASFIPLVAATGGNVGIQSSSLVVQSLASKSVFDDTPWQRFIKGLLIALVNGVVLATFVFLVVVFIYGFESIFGFTIGLAMFCVVLLSSFMGTVTPLVLDRFGINPAIASGPFITTANDLLGLSVYFGVAMLLLKL